MPRQVISVINGTSGNLRTVILRGMERRGEGDCFSEPVLCRCEKDAFTLGQGFRGSSVLLQSGQLSMKHPRNSLIPLIFQQLIVVPLARLHADLFLPYTQTLRASCSLSHFFPFSTLFIVIFLDSWRLFSNIMTTRYFFLSLKLLIPVWIPR